MGKNTGTRCTHIAEKCVLACVKSLRVMIYNLFEFNLFEGGAIHFLSSPHRLQLASETAGYPPIDCIYAPERTIRRHE